MAKVEVRVSDLSGELIRDATEHTIIKVQHPSFSEPITLDALVADLQGRLPEQQEYVALTVNGDQYLLTIPEFNNLFAEEAETVLTRAFREQYPGKRRQQGIDWANPERAGLDHPGRISRREQEYVQAHLHEVNARRREAGQEAIDPSDPAMAEKYGLMPEPIEAADVVEEPPPER